MMGEKLAAPTLVGKAAHKIVKEVLDTLKEQYNVGLYGMAGVGKTAIMMNVYNQLLETQSSLFDKLIWVSGPSDLLDRDEYNRELQENIARAIKIHLPNWWSTASRKGSTGTVSE